MKTLHESFFDPAARARAERRAAEVKRRLSNWAAGRADAAGHAWSAAWRALYRRGYEDAHRAVDTLEGLTRAREDRHGAA